jgi:hypothetical protein
MEDFTVNSPVNRPLHPYKKEASYPSTKSSKRRGEERKLL